MARPCLDAHLKVMSLRIDGHIFSNHYTTALHKFHQVLPSLRVSQCWPPSHTCSNTFIVPSHAHAGCALLYHCLEEKIQEDSKHSMFLQHYPFCSTGDTVRFKLAMQQMLSSFCDCKHTDAVTFAMPLFMSHERTSCWR